MINDRCGTTTGSQKKTGADKQCLTKPTVGYALAKSSQAFADAAAFRSKTAWDTAKQAEDVIIMYLIDTSELANVDPSYYEGRISKIETKEGRKGLRVKHLLGYCSHGALLSYKESEYNYIYEFTEDGLVKGIEQTDGTIKGQELSNFLVGIAQEPVIEGDPQHCFVEMIYADPNEMSNNGAEVKPDFNVLKYKGVYPATLTVVGSPSATELVVRATYGCDGKPLTGLTLSDFVLKNGSGTAQTPDSVSAGTGDDANLYTFVDTDLATGTIETIIVSQTLAMFGTEEAVAFTVS
ncbi:hypothetical protein [uncultured Winogradskyella sp.]|uniref:hypothetical protein n=1 Tax=uncultured Winogradskyella sp. TaxID=395353 RepID=UPI002639BB1F|nr:hypothetical protein [uncultured Winogradskyella sp.]